MRSDLDHLPQRKQAELRRALDILLQGFEEALKGKLSPERSKKGRILKVLLYGSHARGDWVADQNTGYVSDYDLLVVVSGEAFADPDYWEIAEQMFDRETVVKRPFPASRNFIVHSLEDINDQLARGRYFFMDILREGIVLYEAEGHPFAEPKPLTAEAAREEQRMYFDYWFPLAQNACLLAQNSIENGVLRDAAFMYHQATERLYHCTLLVLTLYAPKLHDIKKLRERSEPLDARLIEAWPRATRRERSLFEKLRRAYVDARYSKHYAITTEELAWLSERIAILQEIVRQVCEEALTVEE